MTAPVTTPQADVQSSVEHYLKLAIAAVPVVIGAIAPDLATPVQSVLVAAGGLFGAFEVLAHAIGGRKA